MSDTTNIVFIAFSGLGAILAAIPLPKAIASRNVGTSMLILWTELACIIQLVNAILWNGNLVNWAPVWCDFCGYFLIAADVALVACAVSINRRLYMIVTLDPKRYMKALNMAVDVVLCLVMPCISIALEYVVQQFRFYIFEDLGCVPGIANVTIAFPLVWMIPPLLGITSAVYAYLTIRENLRRNHRLVAEPGASLAWSRRLMALGVVSTAYGLVPTTIAIALLARAYPVLPWPGWESLHSSNNIIIYVPARAWQTSSIQVANIQLRRWTIATLAYAVFIFLGLTSDVKKMYLAPFRSFIGQTTASDLTGSRTTFEKDTDEDENENDHRAPETSSYNQGTYVIPFGRSRSRKREESFGWTDRDRGLEGFELVYPVSRPPAIPTRPTDPLWTVDPEKGGYPAYI